MCDNLNPSFMVGSKVRIKDNANIMQRYPEIVGQIGVIQEVS